MTSAADGHIASGRQPRYRLPDGGPAHGERRGQLPLRRQPLARHELAQRDGGHQPVGDMLPGIPQPEWREQLRDQRITDEGQVHDRTASTGHRRFRTLATGSTQGRSSAADQLMRNRARVRAPATMLDSSTASSMPWMRVVTGP